MIKGQIVGKLILQADYSNSDAIKQIKGEKKKKSEANSSP